MNGLWNKELEIAHTEFGLADIHIYTPYVYMYEVRTTCSHANMWYGRGRTGRTSCYGPGQKAQVLDAK